LVIQAQEKTVCSLASTFTPRATAPKDALATATREHQKRLTNYRRLFGEEDLVTRAGEENVIGWRWGDEAMLTLHVGRATPEGAIEVTSLWLDARCAAE
jgi:hypothetical protein